MDEFWKDARSTLMVAGLLHLIRWEPLTWVTFSAAIFSAAAYAFFKPIAIVIYKNIRHQTYQE